MSASFKISCSLVLSKISDLLLSPKTTLPALMSAAGAPVYLSSLLVPIRESGALLPQMLFSYYLRKVKNRHFAWRLGMVSQVVFSSLMLLSAFVFSGNLAAYLILACLVVFSLSRALCSLTNKDIQGQHIERGKRGKLIGRAGSVSSLIAVIVALCAWYFDTSLSNSSITTIVLAGVFGIFCFILSLLVMWPLKTCVDIKAEENDSRPDSIISMGSTLKTFIVMRSLMSHSALVAPLFTLAYTQNTSSILAYLIIAQASAGVLSSYLWGSISDRSALLSMRVGSFIAVFCCLALVVASIWYTHLLSSAYFICFLFFGLAIGHQGIRTGRKIYSVDIAKNHDRTNFVAKSNSIVGSFMLSAGLLYSLVGVKSMTYALGIMTACLVLGAVISFFLKQEK